MQVLGVFVLGFASTRVNASGALVGFGSVVPVVVYLTAGELLCPSTEGLADADCVRAPWRGVSMHGVAWCRCARPAKQGVGSGRGDGCRFPRAGAPPSGSVYATGAHASQ